MRRAAAILLCLILIVSLCTMAYAATGISASTLAASVSSDGTCLVSMDIQLRLESAVENLTFPIPGNARSITLNGSPARTSRSGGMRHIKLGSLVGNTLGNFTLRVQYSVPNTVKYNEQNKLILTVPMLSGFSYGMEAMDFSITLPGTIEENAKPVFSSGYYQQTIEGSLEYTVSGDRITGKILNTLKDQETLTMSMEVSEDMFPQNPVKQWTIGVEEIVMIVLAGLAMLYWLFFLRCAPFLRARTATPPEGYTAGEIPCALTGQGADLTMMVFSWAQLGYILIHLQDSGRVVLHKRMEMGNERDPYEVKIYRKLFGKRTSVDGTGYHYANLFQKTASTPSDIRGLYRTRSGNTKVFRVLCALIGAFGGSSLANAIAGDALLGFLLVIVLSIFGGVSSWLIQDWYKGLHLRNRTALYLALILCGIWLLLGLPAAELNVAACAALAQLVCGLATAYGGRRTILGRQTASQILGFRKYLRKLSPKDIQRILRIDPDYFFTLAPYALALGVIKSFSKRFGNRRLSGCPYLTTGMDGHMTAAEWCQVMEQAVDSLDARHKRLPLERLLNK